MAARKRKGSWRRRLGLLACAWMPIAVAAACAATSATGERTPATTTTGSTGSGTVDDLIDSACASSLVEANPVPVDVLILFDKSGSMLGPKWNKSTAALKSFFANPDNAGLGVALRFFPDSGCDEATCSLAACSTPKVPLGYLKAIDAPADAQEQLLLDAFLDVVPNGGTPLSVALDGGIEWAKADLDSKPDHKAVVVLVTDGLPTHCNMDGAALVASAKAAFEDRGIAIVAVGLQGASKDLLNAIAAAGGTDAGILIGTATAEEDLQSALNEIRGTQVACDYGIPESMTGESVDLSKVNVVYAPGDGSAKQLFGQVTTAEDCGNKSAWHYDDPLAPTRILLCPAACELVTADPDAIVQVVLGCGTIPG